MNFVGKFDAKLPVDGTGATYVAHTHVDAASAHAPADAIIVPDAKLLFEGDFKRSGVDLVLSKDGHETVVHDYFKGEKRVALSSPDGAHLTGDIVNALAGHVEYAQAGGGVAAAAAVVGHVTKLMGSATAIRNGVSIILNQGDNIEKGDVLQSGADSTLGVTFIDGTVFGLSSNARMVVNEMVYDPNGSSNSSLLSLVAGTISFVAGETAKHGDMKVDTPVATMGIRGTAVLVEIDFGVPGGNGAPSANFQVLVEPDGTTGSYILFDKSTLTPLATVNAAGTLTKISQGVVSFQSGTGLSPEEQKLITDVFQQKFTDNSNPKTDHQFTDSLTPQSLTPIKLLDGLLVTPIVVVVQGAGSVGQTSNLGAAGIQHIPGAPEIATFNQLFNEHINATGSQALDTVITKVNFADINAGDLPTVSVKFTSFTYQTANQLDIAHVLTPAELAAVQAVEAIGFQTDEGNKNTGSATLTYSYPDGAFDFLGAGETLTLTYTAAVNNNFQQNPETAFKTFTITITGTNDVPVITSSVPQAIAFNGGTSVPGGDLIAHVPTSGTISFDDPDLTDTHTVSVKLLLNGLNLPPAPLEIFEHALTATIATDSTGTGFGTVNWKLADLPVYLGDFVPLGQTITLTYAVTVTDSQGATSTQDITITITGTDTPAVVWIATSETGPSPGELLWSNASNWETGTVPTINDDAIVITNQLIGLTPSFPVIINAPAEAKSLTMNDFGTTPPEVINQSTLTLAGDLNMAADSIVHNSGTISVGGLIEVQDTSVLDNSGTLLLQAGGDFSGQSIITNTGSVEISGGTLNVGVDIANSGQGEENVGGQITIDSGAALALGAAAIIGGTVTNDGTLTLDIGSSEGSSVLKNGTLNNNQTLQAGSGAELRNETVTNDGTIEVLALGALLLDEGTTVHNASGTIAVDGTGTLTLNDAGIDGGIINDFSSSEDGNVAGTIDVTGSSTISNAQLNNGQLTVESGQTLTLDGTTVTGSTISNGGTVNIDPSTTLKLSGAALSGGAITNSGTVEITGSSSIDNDMLTNNQLTIDNGKTLTLDDTTVTGGAITNSGATLQVDAGQTLTLKGVVVHGGTLYNSGTVDVETSTGATLDGVAVTGPGTILIDTSAPATPSTTLVLDNGTTVSDGALTVGPVGMLAVKTSGGGTLSHETVNNNNSIEVFAGSALTLDSGTVVTNNSVITVDGSGTLILNDATLTGGSITDNGLIDVTGDSTITGSALQGGRVKVESATTLILAGLDFITGASGSSIANAGVIDVTGTTTLTSDELNNTGAGTLQVDGTLKLSGATLSGGTINDNNLIDVTGDSTMTGSTFINGGQVKVESATLTLDDITATDTSFSQTASNSVISIDAGFSITLVGTDSFTGVSGSSITNADLIEITGTTTLTSDKLINVGSSALEVGGTLVLSDATLTGGTIDDNHLIDVTGSSTISNANLNHGAVTIESGQVLTLDGDTVTGTAFTNVGTGSVIHVDGGDNLSLNNVSVGGGGFTVGAGALVKTSGDVTLTNTAVTNDGTIEVTGGTLKIVGGSDASDAGHSGSIQIDAGAVLDLDGSVSQNVVFNGADAELRIDNSSFSGSISGLAATDEIDLSTIGYGPGTTASYSGGILTITDGTESISMTLTGDISDLHFAGSSDGHGGTLITLNGADDAPVIAAADKAETATVTAASDSNPAASGTLHFTDIDLTDRPTADVTLSVTWADGSTDLSSSLTSAEISALESAFTLSQSGNTNNGTLGWTYQISDSALDFLGAGQTATVTATITLDDHHGGTDTATATVTIDGANEAPAPPTVDISSAALTTNHASQTIGGTGEAGTIVTLYDNGAALSLPTITVDQTGHWSSTVTLADGANSFIAHDTDAFGNVGTSTAVAFTLDTAAPTVTESLAHDTGSSATDKITSNDALTGSGLDNAIVHFSIDGTPIDATTTADAQGDWSFTPTGLADGTHTVVASETDSLGNTGTATLGFTLDTTPPVVTITSPGVTTDTTTQTIHGTVADLAAVGTTVTIYDSSTSGGSISALGASLLTAGHDLVNGMGGATGFGTQVLATGDDNSSSAIDITSVFGTAGVNFFGHDYTSIYLNNNGNITFAEPSGTYTPSSINGGVNNPIIAPFWADVDTRGGAAATTPGGNSTGANQVLYNLDAADGVLTITWDDVGYYSAATDKLDAFQVQLISLGNGNFDIVYRYENINWTTGAASGGNDGLGGTPARAGYSAGDGTNYYELPQSGNQAALLSLPDTPGNTGIAGVDVFQVVDGVIGTPTVTAIGTAIVQSDGTWSTDVTLTNGTNSLTAQDTDLAGNGGTSTPVTYTLDTASDADSAAAFQSFAVADTETQPAHWLNATSGDFATASNWSNGSVPAAADDAVITTTGTYTVTSAVSENVHSIDLGPNVTLDISGGTFAISSGGENDGLIKVEHAGSVLSVGGTVTNTGTIEAFDEAMQNAAPATVALNDGHITGGVVEAIAGGEISAASGSNSIDATVTIDANSSFVVDHGATVTVNASSSALATTNDGTIEVQSGGSAIWAGALSGTGAIHIDNGASFELNTTSAAGGQTVTFEGSTGSLTLDHPASFTGTISGFTGDGNLSGSDQIDLKGIDHNSNSFNESFNADTDTLSVTDGTNSAVLHFNGTYEAANFSFTTDNSGGTIVYDPPVSDNAAAKPTAVTANGNGFVFNFADHGQDASGTHPATDTHLFDGQTFVNADSDPNKPHDDSHAAPVPENMDAATIAAVKAQLHAHDFHFA